MNLTITPGNPLLGQVELPGDKSLSHRAALLAGMACGESLIQNFLVSGVTQAMLRALTALGVAWELKGTSLRVVGKGLAGWRSPSTPIDCGNSATTLRLLAGALAAAGIPAVLDGSAGLRSRPMTRIVEPLRQMGVAIESAPGGCAPLRLAGRPAGQSLRAIEYTMPVASAQVKSCILLAALAADGVTVLHEPGLSRDHTERMFAGLGIEVDREQAAGQADYVTRLRCSAPATPPVSLVLSPLNISLPGDFSAAAFLIVGALIAPGSKIRIHNVGLNPTRCGLLEALTAMGADIRPSRLSDCCGEPAGDLEIHHSVLRGGRVAGEQVVRMIDEFPAFAVAAAYANGSTLVQDAAELRNKESDRISALCQGLRLLGVQAKEAADGFTILGGDPVKGGRAGAHGDHRLAMALALVGLASTDPVTVVGSEIIHESFPEFAVTLANLGADVLITDETMGANTHVP
jgi:3-phosphoshikimate 1-carboxyvinyltransferase